MPAVAKHTVRDMKNKAKDLMTCVQAIKAKGDDITAEEAAQLRQDTDALKAVVVELKGAQVEEASGDIDELKSDLDSLFAIRRPATGGDGRQKPREDGWGRESIGDSLIRHDAYKSFNPGVQGSSVGIEFSNLISLLGSGKTTFTTSASTLTGYERPPGMIMVEQQRLTVADLLAQGITDKNTIRYMQEDTFTNGATTVAEGATKPEAAFDTSEADAPVRKIAVTARVSDELYDDFSAMQSYIDERLRYMVGFTEEAQLLNGDGNSPNLRGILQTSGIQTQAVGADTNLDAIHKAITKVRAVGFYEPDAIVLHPTDYQLLRLAKDGNTQYYGGGAFLGPYGNGSYPGLVGPWGLRAVVTTSITAGTALVGAFKMGAMLYRRKGVSVQMTNSNEDDFKKNLISIRCEERLALCVWRPKAFCTVTSIA